jgi:hypothetical protein
MRRYVVPAVALALTGATAGSLMAAGAFSNTWDAGSVTLTAGRVDLTAAAAGAPLTVHGMLPGDRITRELTITNAGTLPLRYAVTSRTTEAVLSARLDMTVKDGVTHCTDAGFAADGTVPYGPGDAGSVAALPIIGDVSTGQQAGDRTAQPGATQQLCVQLVLPTSTDNSFQSLTTTTTLDVQVLSERPVTSVAASRTWPASDSPA